MLKLTNDEVYLLSNLVNKRNTEILLYDVDNNFKFEIPKATHRFTTKFNYDPYPSFEEDAYVESIKKKGTYQLNDPYYIQQRLKESKRNDRFKHLPCTILGIDSRNISDFYFYNVRNKNKGTIGIKTILEFPTRVKISTELGNTYHVYSPFTRIGKSGIKDKNHSLKALGYMLSKEGASDTMLSIFKLIVKGIVYTHNIVPDYIVTVESSKDINTRLIKKFKDDPLFTNTQVISVAKPKNKDILDAFNHAKLKPDDHIMLYNLLQSDDSIKMKSLNAEDRKIYSELVKDLFKNVSNYGLKDKKILFIDDVVTTGNTISNIIIPLFEEHNKILPVAFLIR